MIGFIARPPLSTAAAASASGDKFLTARPATRRQQLANTGVVWLALMAYWVVTDLLIARFPPGGRAVRPDGWLVHAGFTLAGLAAIWCAARTGFPAAWDARIPAARRLLRPALAGLALGLVAIAAEAITGATKALEAALGEPFTVAFPGSLLVYSAGSVVWEAFFLLIPVPVLLWLLSGVLLRGRGQEATFWALAALSAAAEPLMQAVPLMLRGGGTVGSGAFAFEVALSYAFNLTAAAYFRRYGLLAAVFVRLTYYLAWHILYGNFLA